MQMRKSQSAADVILRIPLLYNNGSAAAGLSLASLSTKVIKPDGAALAGYDEAAFSEPNADGVYVVKFPATAANKAFTVVDAANPYTVTLDSTAANVDPMPVDVFIVSRMPFELARPEDILVDPATDRIDGSLIDAAVTSRPTIAQVEGSPILAKEATVSTRASQASLNQKPTLSEIEASAVIAKEATVSARPTLSEIEASSALANAIASAVWANGDAAVEGTKAFTLQEVRLLAGLLTAGCVSTGSWDPSVAPSGFAWTGGPDFFIEVRAVEIHTDNSVNLGTWDTVNGWVQDAGWGSSVSATSVLLFYIYSPGGNGFLPGNFSFQVNATDFGERTPFTVTVDLPGIGPGGGGLTCYPMKDGSVKRLRDGGAFLASLGRYVSLPQIEGSQVLAKEATVAARASQATADAIKAKTDNLPLDPAGLAAIEGSPVLAKESTSQSIRTDTGAIRAGVPCTGMTAEAKAAVNAEVVDALDVDAYPELAGTPAPPWTFRKMVQWLFQYFKHPRRMTDVEEKLYQADGATVAGTRTVSETQTEVSLGKMS